MKSWPVSGAWSLILALSAPQVLAPPAHATEKAGQEPKLRFRTWKENGPPETSVDVLFVGDGYVQRELNGKFWTDVDRYAKRLFLDPPFSWYSKRFNVRAALLASKERGCKQGPEDEAPTTALDSAFDSKTGRLLCFRDTANLTDVVNAAGAVDIVFVMVNTERYGGGGTRLYSIEVGGHPLPAPTFAAQDTTSFLIAVHELGHSFGDLADEYADDSLHEKYPLPEGEDIDEANVTLAVRVDASSSPSLRRTLKWGHFLDLPGAKGQPWMHEGGHYRATGVLRPWATCRMRDHDHDFCPVCCEEMTKAIFAACGDPFDDAAYHEAHPLKLWR